MYPSGYRITPPAVDTRIRPFSFSDEGTGCSTRYYQRCGIGYEVKRPHVDHARTTIVTVGAALAVAIHFLEIFENSLGPVAVSVLRTFSAEAARCIASVDVRIPNSDSEENSGLLPSKEYS